MTKQLEKRKAKCGMSIKAALQTLDAVGAWSPGCSPLACQPRYISKAVLQRLKFASQALAQPIWYIRYNHTTALRLLLMSTSLVLMSMSKVKLWLQAWLTTSMLAAASEHCDSLQRDVFVALPVHCSKLLCWLRPISFWSERCDRA